MSEERPAENQLMTEKPSQTVSKILMLCYIVYGGLLLSAGLAVLLIDGLPVVVALCSSYVGLILVWLSSGILLLLGYDRAREVVVSSLLLHVLFSLSWVAALYDLVPVFVSNERLVEPVRTACIAVCFVAGIAVPGWFLYRIEGHITERILNRSVSVVLLLSLVSLFAFVAALAGLAAPSFTGWIHGISGQLISGLFGLLSGVMAAMRWLRAGLLALLLALVAAFFSLTIDGGDVQLRSVFLTPVIAGTVITLYALYRFRKNTEQSTSS
jgi:hypothetical protein